MESADTDLSNILYISELLVMLSRLLAGRMNTSTTGREDLNVSLKRKKPRLTNMSLEEGVLHPLRAQVEEIEKIWRLIVPHGRAGGYKSEGSSTADKVTHDTFHSEGLNVFCLQGRSDTGGVQAQV